MIMTRIRCTCIVELATGCYDCGVMKFVTDDQLDLIIIHIIFFILTSAGEID